MVCIMFVLYVVFEKNVKARSLHKFFNVLNNIYLVLIVIQEIFCLLR